MCRSPWTLAVAVVLLPVVVQLLGSQAQLAQLAVLAKVLEMVVQRFSPSILACKSKDSSRKIHSFSSSFSVEGIKSRRVSATSDLQQRTTCYTALHKAWVALGDRLECKDGHLIASDNADIISLLTSLRQSLTPFSTQLPTSS